MYLHGLFVFFALLCYNIRKFRSKEHLIRELCNSFYERKLFFRTYKIMNKKGVLYYEEACHHYGYDDYDDHWRC